jgi:1-acyl-sn-glycerol-3-phosphate acyltransferase
MRLRVAGDPWLYAVARVLLVAAVAAYGRVRVHGAGHLPAAGPAIVVANHPSDVDPILLGVAFPRTLHFLADVVQFRRGFVGPVIDRLAAIPIHKGKPDRAALQRALALLASGEVIVVFAEGDLYRQEGPAAFRSGVSFLGARSGAPLVPVAICGAERLWSGRRLRRPWIDVNVGKPVLYGGRSHGRASYDRMADQLRESVIELCRAAEQETRPPARRSGA